MEFAKLDGSSPLMPFVATAILLAAAGIFYLGLSRNVAIKRVVLPATLTLFSVAVGLAVVGDGRFRDQPAVLALIGVGLLINALYTGWMLRFCADCGATIPRSPPPPWRCETCRAKKGTA